MRGEKDAPLPDAPPDRDLRSGRHRRRARKRVGEGAEQCGAIAVPCAPVHAGEELRLLAREALQSRAGVLA